MRKCEICSKFISKRGFGSHLKYKHNIKSKEYYDIFIREKNEGICLNCACDTNFKSISKGYSKFCSTKCAQSYNITKEKQRKSKLGKKRYDMIGDLNPAKRTKVRKEISKSKKENWKNGVYDSEDYRKKLSIGISNALIGKSYEERYGEKKAINLKKIRKQKMLNGQAQDMCSKITRISKPQLKLYKMVKSIFPNAKLEYRVGNYSLDIAIPELKLDIEYDCSYWHTKEKDERRDKINKSKGWKVIRFVDYVPSIDEIKKHF